MPWPVRSVAAGTAGTAALTLFYDTERRLRRRHHGPLDYDDSLVPGRIVASIMHLPAVSAREDWDLGWNVVLESGGLLVGKKIKIELNIEAVRQA